MSEALRVLVVDDYEPDLRVFSEILKRKGCVVDGAQSYAQAIEKLAQDHYDVVVIDLRMPDSSGKENPDAGVELLREIRRQGIIIGVVVLTGQPTMESLKKTEELGISSYLVKDKLFGIMEPAQGAEEFYNEVRRAARRRMSVEEAVEEIPGNAKANPFALPYSVYQKLDSRGISEVQRRAHEMKDGWAHEKLAKEGISWLVLCGNKVVRKSADMQQLPKADELDQMGREHDLVPFLFIYFSDTEEVCRAEVPWRQTKDIGDFYPSVDLRIRGNGKEVVLCSADLDTGSPYIHLSLEELLDLGVITEQDIAKCYPWRYVPERPMHGKRTPCYLHSLEIGVSPNCKEIECEVIERWRDSGFCRYSPRRKALVGRPLMLRLPIMVVLDGAKQATHVLKAGENRDGGRAYTVDPSYQQNHAAFCEMKKSQAWLEKHEGKYVCFVGGKHVEADHDRKALLARVRAKHAKHPRFMTQVTRHEEGVVIDFTSNRASTSKREPPEEAVPPQKSGPPRKKRRV